MAATTTARRATKPRTTTARGGIDLGGTKIEAIVVDPRNSVLGASRRPTPTEGGPEDVAPDDRGDDGRLPGRRARPE